MYVLFGAVEIKRIIEIVFGCHDTLAKHNNYEEGTVAVVAAVVVATNAS